MSDQVHTFTIKHIGEGRFDVETFDFRLGRIFHRRVPSAVIGPSALVNKAPADRQKPILLAPPAAKEFAGTIRRHYSALPNWL
jgi:hypothetical protein